MMASIDIIDARSKVTPNDFSPVVGVINWVMMVSTVLTGLTRIGMKLVVSRELNNDDFVISFAVVFSIAQTIAVAVQVGHGIGQRQDSLSQASLQVYQKAGYSVDLLFIINLALSKISVLLLLRQITPVRPYQIGALGTMVLVAAWSIISFFASAFQCGVPGSWKILDPKCFDQTAFWTFFGIMNILTEFLIIALSISVLWGVHISRKSRWTIIACFATRISIIGAVIAQLVFLRRFSGSSDKTFDGWHYDLLTVIVQNLSVITACVPFVKNFMLGLESGMIRIDDQERRRQMSTAAYNMSSNSDKRNQYIRKPSAGAADGSNDSARAPHRSRSGQEDTDLELREIDRMPLNTGMRPEPVSNSITIQTAGRPEDGSRTSDEGRIRATTKISVIRGGR